MAPPTTWFDLTCTRRRLVRLPPNPPDWLHHVEVEFRPGEVAAPEQVIIADDIERAWEGTVAGRHGDGSVARLIVHLPVSPTCEEAFANRVHIYFGRDGAAASDIPHRIGPVRYLPDSRRVVTPWFVAGFTPKGGLASLHLESIGQDILPGTSSAVVQPVIRDSGGPWTDTPAMAPIHSRCEQGSGCVSIDAGAVAPDSVRTQLRWKVFASHIRLHYEYTARTTSGFCPLVLPQRTGAGVLLAPDDEPWYPGRTGSLALEIGPGQASGLVWSSQAGLLALVLPDDDAPDHFEVLEDGRALLGYRAVPAGQVVSGTLLLVPAPCAGDLTTARLERLRLMAESPTEQPWALEPPEVRPAAYAPVVRSEGESATIETGGRVATLRRENGALTGEAGTLRTPGVLRTAPLLIAESDDGSPWTSSGAQVETSAAGCLLADEVHTSPTGARATCNVRITPRLVSDAVFFEEAFTWQLGSSTPEELVRFVTRRATPCGPPDWAHARATVVIPGQMALGNYCPGQPHGGGPKWGPAAEPETCPHCKPGVAPGHCDHWTVPASRIANLWAAAVDVNHQALVLLATEPRAFVETPDGARPATLCTTLLGNDPQYSQMPAAEPPGAQYETALGFHSPAAGTTTLIAATPTRYEPVVPHGYGGFDPVPRRDCYRLRPGDCLRWRLLTHAAETSDLNAWAAPAEAAARFARAQRPAAWRQPQRESLELLLRTLHDAFYLPEHGILTYGTGPDGQTTPVGFTGMAHSALALYAGAEQCRAATVAERSAWEDAGRRVLDEVADAFLKGPEFPFVAFVPGKGWTTGSGEPGYLILCALDNLLEAAQFAQRNEREGVPPRWLEAIRRCSDAWARAQSPEGAFPLKHPAMGPEFPVADYDATNVTVGVVACLIEAALLLRDDRLFDAAVRGAQFYGVQVDEGKLYGGPGDIEALGNSEVPMFALRAFLRLALITRNTRHAKWARAAAGWRLSVQFSHAHAVGHGSLLYRQGWCGVGCEGASASNLHAVTFGGMNYPDYRLAERLPETASLAPWLRRRRDLAQYAGQQYGGHAGGAYLPLGHGTESFFASDCKWGNGSVLVLRENPHLGFMSWTSGWAAYALMHAIREAEETGARMA